MEQYAAFLLDNVMLAMLFVGLLGALVWTSISTTGSGQVSPADTVRLISREDAVVIDIRPDGEFRNGHIVNAIHIPFDQIDSRLGRLGKYRSKPVIAACRTGQQSAGVAQAPPLGGIRAGPSPAGGNAGVAERGPAPDEGLTEPAPAVLLISAAAGSIP